MFNGPLTFGSKSERIIMSMIVHLCCSVQIVFFSEMLGAEILHKMFKHAILKIQAVNGFV